MFFVCAREQHFKNILCLRTPNTSIGHKRLCLCLDLTLVENSKVGKVQSYYSLCPSLISPGDYPRIYIELFPTIIYYVHRGCRGSTNTGITNIFLKVYIKCMCLLFVFFWIRIYLFMYVFVSLYG